MSEKYILEDEEFNMYFTEKILRIQPNIEKLYLLVRAKDANSATQRIHSEVVEKELFRILKDKWGGMGNLHAFISEKVVAVPGEVSYDNLGVKDFNLCEEMWRNIDIILNFAATTNFDERYDVALGTNTTGAFHVLSFAKKCVNIKMLLHVSTAYVCGERSGIIAEDSFHIDESLNGTSKLDITAEKKLVDETLNQLRAKNATEETIISTMKDLGIKRARLYGWPNTYVFTKAMGEMLLGYYKENLPVVIIRPTMITSTYREPFPGWIEGLRTLDSVVIGYGKGKVKCLPAKPDTIIDLIPADMVVNAMIKAMVAKAYQHFSDPIIYHVSSSMRNAIKLSNIRDFGYRYFTKNPLNNKNGKAIKVDKFIMLDTWTQFRIHIAIRYLLPLKGLKLVNHVLFQRYKGITTHSDRKLKLVMRLAELYRPYMFFKGIFDDTNSERLRMTIRETKLEAVDAFNFDPNCIDWEDYMMNIHIPGLLTYVVI
ncbi:hypothetical protein Dsin_019799 [Dipteronia sinensis]|uniref:Fatty acyl-CoA reductase n=1 Tax=Dipteronia sinensis TaxID=43782 RepID=A0AAE0E356_9ROSI|nr:hypothetical protein Dsin_019799 [Dipteronia sinensis]